MDNQIGRSADARWHATCYTQNRTRDDAAGIVGVDDKKTVPFFSSPPRS
jgi:hypothetical protein